MLFPAFSFFKVNKIMKEESIYKYFQVGDIVKDCPESCWGETKFIIRSFYGNWYLPIAYVHQLGKPDTNKYKCNFDVRELRLVGAAKRPLKKVEKKTLIRMMSKGVIEAKRELKIRVNNKEL